MIGQKFMVRSTAEGYARNDGVYTANEHDTIENAVESASDIATRTQTTVYIYQAVKKIAPKQEVVVTELALS